ncbi:MAG TPA: hypothetical protein VFM93_00910, partial [Candidatus Limnocylindria bacterium]|nr:hypothetical protein [Candidatus Limnocylindria bacterium]
MRILLGAALLLSACDLVGLGPSQVPDLCPDERFSRGEGYDEASRECLWSAYSEGRAANFRTTHLTRQGDPVVYQVSVSAGKVEIVYDNTLDTFATTKGKQTLQCQRLERSVDPGT